MREIVGVTLEPEASDLEKGEEEIAIRQRIRESLVLEVQASDLEDMEQFKKGLPLEQGSLRQASGQAQWADSSWQPLCQRLMKMFPAKARNKVTISESAPIELWKSL